MKTDELSPRERWLAVLQGKIPDRVPLDYWATAEASAKLVEFLGVPDLDEVKRRLHIDPIVWVEGRYAGPRVTHDADCFGCVFKSVHYDGGIYRECIQNPLAKFNTVEEIEAHYRWPDPDWWNTDHLPRETQGKEHLPVRGGGSEPFLRYCLLRGDEQAFLDLLLNPDIAHYCLSKLFDLAWESTRRIYETIPGRVMISYVAEDLGSQEGLLMSPKQVDEFLLPGMRRMIELVHQAGAYVFHHNDGAIARLVPALIDAGIDVLNPVQWRCKGMDRAALKHDFGDRLVFHGAMDNQQTLPFGTADDVRREVVENIEVLGKDGGYILAPCHNLQANTPPENIISMYETAWERGWY